MKDILYVDANFRLENGWGVTHPDVYDVRLSEPLQKGCGTGLGFLLADHLSIVVLLQQSGLTDWIIGKGYDQLWSYLKSLSISLPKSPLSRSCTIKVKDNNGNVRATVELDNFDASHIGDAEINVKNEVRKSASGDVVETSSIHVKTRRK